MHNCQFEKLIPVMQGDIQEIKGDVKSLLTIKWKMAGAGFLVGVISACGAFVLTILSIAEKVNAGN